MTRLIFRSGRDLRGLALAVLLGLVLVPGVLFLATWEIRREFDRSRILRQELNQSFETRSQLQTVFSLIQDAETGQRGYIITGQRRFLEPYYQAEARIGQEVARLETMERRAEPAERGRIIHLRSLIDQKLQNLRASIRLRDEEGVAAAIILVGTGRGKQLMDEIRQVVTILITAERVALEARSTEDLARTTRTERFVLFLFVTLGGLLAVAYTLVVQQARGRTRLLSEVRGAAARQEAILESSQDAIITFNPSGTIEAINRAGETLFGRTRGELRRRDIGLLINVTSEDDSPFLQRLLGDNADVTGVIREFTAKRADGSSFPVEAAIGGVQLPDGMHLIASIRDISERRRIEQMKAEFISTVSHELRTPLTSIAGSLGLIVGGATGALEPKAERLITIAHANSQRLIRLINDILDMEKLESGKMTFNPAAIDLVQLAARAIEGLDGMAGQAGVTMRIESAPGELQVLGDSDRLLQVVTNLLSNAVKFSPPGGLVTVSLHPGAERLRLTVRDQGLGVPEAFQSRIFSKFAQADSSDTRQKGGTGLGLVISKEIVERHGGRLWFDANPGEGAAFHVELSLLAKPATASTAGRRVLICEDDADIARVLATMIEAEGFSAAIAGTLAEAEASLAQGHPYVALMLDVGLPDGSGLDLLQRLRAVEATRNLPVLIVSAQDGHAAALDILDWMQKPIDPSRLREALSRVAGSARTTRPKVLHIEDDPDVRLVVASALAADSEVQSVGDLASAREAVRLTPPDLVILDIALGDGCGLDLLPDLIDAAGKPIPVIIFSAQAFDDEQARSCVAAVLTKSRTSLDQLAGMVRRLGQESATREAA